jgi:hypothetical protein
MVFTMASRYYSPEDVNTELQIGSGKKKRCRIERHKTIESHIGKFVHLKHIDTWIDVALM